MGLFKSRGVRLERRGPSWFRSLDWFVIKMVALFGVWLLFMVLLRLSMNLFFV